MSTSDKNANVERLSERELEILRWLDEGLSNREISQRLFLSVETVKWYNKRMYQNLNVNTRAQAVARARALGLLDRTGDTVNASSFPARHHLPAELTSLVGREREVSELKGMLRTTRLVTLTGPGGIGKTRLALRVASSIAAGFAHGVNFIALATTTNPARVPNTISRALGVIEQPDRPLVDSLQRYFGNKRLLLVLDNFEHVLIAAPLLTELLTAAPRLHILVTSREPLRLNGEHVFDVLQLPIPTPVEVESLSSLADVASVSLFVQRARAASSGFRLTEDNARAVADICIQLDGLPLGIELVATRVNFFSPQDILSRLVSRLDFPGRLRDLPMRQRTLRDSIDWSYNLLDADEQRLLSRLGVFAGGFSLEAAEAICDSKPSGHALKVLESLQSKSLIYRMEGTIGGPRFNMLATIHEYARELLAAGGEERRIRSRHLHYFLALAEKMEPGFRRHGQLLLLKRTEEEYNNLRLAFEWAMEDGKTEAGARLLSAIQYYFKYTDRRVEGRQWLIRVFHVGDIEKIPGEYRLRLIYAATRLAGFDGEPMAKELLLEKGLALARVLGNRRYEALLLLELANFADIAGETEVAFQRCEQGLTILQELDDKSSIATALNVMGEIARNIGDYDRARTAYEASAATSRESGEIFFHTLVLNNLAFVAYRQGEYELAKEYAITHLRKMHEIKMMPCTIRGLELLAGPLSRLGEPEKAARLSAASEALLTDIGGDIDAIDLQEYEEYRANIRGQLDKISYRNAGAMGRSMTLEQAVAYALAE